MPKLTRSAKAFAAVMVALASVPLFQVPVFFFHILAITFMYAAMAESWNIIGGYTGYLNIGSAAFFGVGAYTTAIMLQHYNLSPFLTAPLGGIIAVGLALAVGLPTLKLKGAYFALATLALTFLMGDLFIGFPELTGGGKGIYNLHVPGLSLEWEPKAFYLIFFALMIITILVASTIENSKFGLGLMAIREDEDAARMSGINAPRLKSIAFLISAFFIGVAGGLYTPYLSYINPPLAFSILITISPVLMTILGGRGFWLGPIIGAFILDLVRQYLSFLILSVLNELVFGAMLVIVMIIMPRGILGYLRERLKTKLP